MAGKVQSYEITQTKRGPKNTLLGVRPVPFLMWQVTDKKGNIMTGFGVEVEPGNIRKFPPDLMKSVFPVGGKLQKLLLAQLHPELVKDNEEGPAAAPPGRTPKVEAVSRMPKDIDVVSFP